MNAPMINPRVKLGDNNPPPDPLDDLTKAVNDAYGEALLWLDGEKVANQEQADALGKLYTDLDDAQKLAESTRKELKQPHMDAGAAVDAVYAPLRDKAEKARKAVKVAIQTWNDHLADLAEIEAKRIRDEADALETAAQAARDAAQTSNNLAAMEEAEQQLDNAVTLSAMAKKVENTPAITKTAGARGIGRVPMHWVGRIVDRKAVLQHYMVAQPEELTAWLQGQLDKDVRAGRRAIAGCEIKEEKKL